MISPELLAIATPAIAIVAAAAVVSLATPMRFGARFTVLILAAYSGLSEIDVEPLAGPTADRLMDASLGLLAVGGVALAWLLERRPGVEMVGGFASPSAWLVLFFGAGVILFPFSLSPIGTLQRGVVAICLVLLVALFVRRVGFIHVIAAITVGSACLILASIGWELFGAGTPVNEITGAPDTGIAGLERHNGLTSSPNQFGRVSAAVLVGGALLVRSPVYRQHGWLFQAIALAGLFFAQSRTAMIIGVVVFLAAHARAGRGLAVVVLVLTMATGGLALWSTGNLGVDTVTRDSGGAATQELTTATGRTTLWALSFDLALDQPIAGVGAFATSEALAPAFNDGRISFKADDAHNFVLNTFLAQGLFGLTMLAGFSFASLRRLLDGRALLGSGLLMLLVAGLGLMENLFWKPNSTLIVLAVAAAGMSEIRQRHTTERERLRFVRPAPREVRRPIATGRQAR